MKSVKASGKSIFGKLRQKIIQIQGEPKNIAMSFAMGSFIGVSPLIGMQIILSVALSFVFRLSRTASVVGVINTNWTKGLFLYPVNFKIGAAIIGNQSHPNFSAIFHGNVIRNLIEAGGDVFFSLLIGGCITGLLIAIFYYNLVLFVIKNFRKKENNMKTAENEKYALLTGASLGLGKALAGELASRKINLLLVSLPGEGLPELGEELARSYKINVHWFETDLASPEAVYEISSWAQNYNVQILINNAGIGGTRAFEKASPCYLDNIIQVNVRATSMLTRLMLPVLKQNKQSYILNVASMASFSPFAFKTVYPASKAFIYSFSRGLQEELRGTGVQVSVIHPGPIKTNPDVTARIEKQGLLGKIGLITPEKLASIAIRQLLKRDSLILPGVFNKLNWLLMSIIPNYWKLLLVSRVVRREIAQDYEKGNNLVISHS